MCFTYGQWLHMKMTTSAAALEVSERNQLAARVRQPEIAAPLCPRQHRGNSSATMPRIWKSMAPVVESKSGVRPAAGGARDKVAQICNLPIAIAFCRLSGARRSAASSRLGRLPAITWPAVSSWRILSTAATRSGSRKSRCTAPTQGDCTSNEVHPAARAASASCHLSLITYERSRSRVHWKAASRSSRV